MRSDLGSIEPQLQLSHFIQLYTNNAAHTGYVYGDKENLSVRTVQTHRHNICKKCGLQGRHALVKWLWRGRNGELEG